ncbi:unnamed protein product [Peniophora sp. CBMAI 1063]|nr:unnamed protein product [Peniophora sp. CBMAI 1063]
MAHSTAKPVFCSEDTKGLKPGDVVSSWITSFEWDESCVRAEEADRWTKESDPPCDATLDILFPDQTSSVGVDLLGKLQSSCSDSLAAPTGDPAHELYDSLRNPPHDLCATPEDIALASDLFLDYAAQIAQSLAFFSLAGGFASSRIVATLNAVSYLVPGTAKYDAEGSPSPSTRAQDERTYIRLMETFQFVLDVMGCTSSTTYWPQARCDEKAEGVPAIAPGGVGWKSAVRVRMLHGIARRRAREHLSRASQGSLDFVPVNQLDMSGTLAAFSTVPIWCLERLGFNIPYASKSAYLAVWRQVGFYMGISPDILRSHFMTPAQADKFPPSVVIHLFSPHPELQHLVPPTLPILRALADRPHTRTSYQYNCALARHLIGPTLSDHLSIPRTTLPVYLRMRLSLAVQALPCHFARVYPRRGWLLARRAALREALVAVVEGSGLGMRRTAFRPRQPGASDLDPGVREQERIEAKMGTGAAIVRSFRAVWVEMAAVLVIAGLLVSSVLWRLYAACVV